MDHLIAELERTVAARAAEILAEAEAEAEAIAAAAEREVERTERVRLAGCATEWRGDAARRIAGVRGEAARVVLRARASLLGRVFERSATRIAERRLPEGYGRALAAWTDLALRYLGDAPAEIACAPGDEPAIRAVLGERPVDLRVDPTIPAGFVLRSADGVLEVDGTLAGALDRREDELAIEVLELFEVPA